MSLENVEELIRWGYALFNREHEPAADMASRRRVR